MVNRYRVKGNTARDNNEEYCCHLYHVYRLYHVYYPGLSTCAWLGHELSCFSVQCILSKNVSYTATRLRQICACCDKWQCYLYLIFSFHTTCIWGYKAKLPVLHEQWNQLCYCLPTYICPVHAYMYIHTYICSLHMLQPTI